MKRMSSSEMANRLSQFLLVYRNMFKTLMKPQSLPLTQYHILEMLAQNENMRMGSISQKMAISRPNLTPLIDKLVARDFAVRLPDQHDRRVTYISITPAGRTALEKEHAAISKSIRSFIEQLTDKEYQDFCQSMDIISGLAQRFNS